MLPVRSVCVLGFVLFAAGCSKPTPAAPKARLRPEVSVVDVKKKNIVRLAGQPGFVESYEQTAIYARASGFVKEWNVDIGDVISQGQILTELAAPDLIAEYHGKKDEVILAKVNIDVAREIVKVTQKNLENAVAQVKEARANLGKYVADVEFRKADYDRIQDLFDKNAVAKPALDSAVKAWKSSIAFKEAADAEILVAQAKEAARTADIKKTEVDVQAAIAQATVAQARANRLAALVDYLSVKAPYDGTVIARNVVKGDFVQTTGGDLSGTRSNQEGAASRSTPLYVVARTDFVRIFLDVSEMEAAGVSIGNRAWVTIEAFDGKEIAAHVARTSWALSTRSRTLRVEIDVPNPQGQLRWAVPASAVGVAGFGPGPLLAASALAAAKSEGLIRPNMYAYGKVEIQRNNVWALPLEAVVELGNQTSCYEHKDGKAVLLPIQRGIDGQVEDGTVWVEVARKRVGNDWVPFNGTEKIIVGDLSQISDGEAVRVQGS